MPRGRRAAGGGGIIFAVALAIGFTVFGPKGGAYSAGEIGAFVGQGIAGLIASVYLFVASFVGLTVLMAYLSESLGSGLPRRVAWASGVLGAWSLVIGWALYLTPSTAVAAGGPAPDAALSHTLITAGFILAFGVSGVSLGIALVTCATAPGRIPTWVRAFTVLAGLAAFLTWAFILAVGWSPNQWLPAPFYGVVLWGLVVGIWLPASGNPDAPSRTAPRRS